MGKWTYLKNKLPPLPDPDPKHKDLVERAIVRRRQKDQTLGQNLLDYVHYRDAKAELEIQKSAMQIEIDALEKLIKDDFEEQGLHKMTLDTGETISISPEPHAQVQDQQAMVEWAKSVGLEKSLTLPWQTLNSHLKQLFEKGESEMPGVKPFLRTKVSLRRNE